jgi:Flp pilus assembly protein TadD
MQSPLALATASTSNPWSTVNLYLQLGRLNQSLQLAYGLAQQDTSQQQRYLNHQNNVIRQGAEFAEEIGDYSRAIHYWNQVLQCNPNQGDAWYGLGLARANLQDYSGAEAAMQEALQLAPGDPKIQSHLANLQSLLDRGE